MSDLIDETARALLAKNILLLEGDVDGKMVDASYECLQILEGRGSPEIEIRIFSNGGSVRAGLDIYDAIHRYPGKKTGVVYAYARSMSAVILQACDERVCLQHAVVLIHHINRQSISLDDIEDSRRLEKLRKSMLTDQIAIYAILARRTGKTKAVIRKTCRKDQDMDAEEALNRPH